MYFSQSLKWTEEHDVLMLRELMVLQPWKHMKGTSEIGEDWKKIDSVLKCYFSSTIPCYSAVCSLSLFCNGNEKKGKVREEERASGIASEEETEL